MKMHKNNHLEVTDYRVMLKSYQFMFKRAWRNKIKATLGISLIVGATWVLCTKRAAVPQNTCYETSNVHFSQICPELRDALMQPHQFSIEHN